MFGLIVTALVLPIVMVVLHGIARILLAMADHTGSTALERVALGFGVVWVVDLVIMLILQSLTTVLHETRRQG